MVNLVIGIGAPLGYIVVGVVMSIIIAALTVDDYNGKVEDALLVFFGAFLWPIALLVLAWLGVCRVGAPFGRAVSRGWKASVRRLNPEYK